MNYVMLNDPSYFREDSECSNQSRHKAKIIPTMEVIFEIPPPKLVNHIDCGGNQ